MKKVLTVLICALTLSAAAQRLYNLQIDAEGNIKGKAGIVAQNKLVVLADTDPATNGNMAAYGATGLMDTGISLSNFVWQVSYTNVSQILSSMGQAGGIAQLDENGKIDASLIYTITVVWAGAQAVDVP